MALVHREMRPIIETTTKTEGGKTTVTQRTIYRLLNVGYPLTTGQTVAFDELSAKSVEVTQDYFYGEDTSVCTDSNTTGIPTMGSFQALRNKTISVPTIFTVDVDETRSDASGNAYATNTAYIKFPDGSILPIGGEKEPTS